MLRTPLGNDRLDRVFSVKSDRFAAGVALSSLILEGKVVIMDGVYHANSIDIKQKVQIDLLEELIVIVDQSRKVVLKQIVRKLNER